MMSRSNGSTSASSEDRVTPELGHAEDNLRMLNEIRDKRKALLSCPVGYSNRAERASELVDALFILYGRIGGQALIDEAIKVHREFIASRLYERDFFNRPIAPSYRPVRYKEPAGARHHSLDQAIKLGHDRLSSHPHGHPARASSCAGLGNALLARHNQVGDAALLNEAIELHREALSLRPHGHPDRASSCAHLAASLRQRYKQAGDESLDEALELEHEALALRPQVHPNRASSCASLAVSIYERYNQTGHVSLLNQAIELNREALALRPPGHADRAASCGDLGALLHMRYTQTGERSLLNEAIELGREALTLRPLGHPKRSMTCKNLTHALFASYNRTGNVALLDEAIDMCSYVVESGSTSEVSQSLTLLSQAHLLPGPHHSLWKASHYLHRSVLNEVDNIHGFLHSLTYILSLLWNISPAWTPCVTSLLCRVYAMIIDRLPLAASFALDASAQLQTLKSTRQIGTDACVAAVLATQHSKALELLDRGHGVVWTQALHQRDPQMEHAPPDLAFELETLLRAIAVPTAAKFAESPYHHRDIRHRQNTRIQAILREIRAKPNMKGFMLGSTYDTLRKAAHKHPVVTLVAARGHAFAFMMSSDAEDEPHVLRLDLTLDDLRLLRDSTEKAGLRSRARDARECDLDARLGFQKREINVNHKPLRVLADIWRKIVKPVIDHLQLKKNTGRSRPRLHWCANGDFVFLPLHAAGIYQGTADNQVCCSDYVVSSYTPTISALLRAQAQAAPVVPTDIKMLLVGEDCARNPNLGRLWNVQRELQCIESITKTKLFGHTVETIASAATIERVTARVKSAGFVHLACHGIQHRTNALESGFHLSDGMLTISKLMTLELDNPWFAYLSACETAKGDAEQPDQVMHLAAAMLFAGFKSVVATMWSISDADGPNMAEWFYEELLSSETIDADAVAYALDGAVQKLRVKQPAPQRWAQFIHMGA